MQRVIATTEPPKPMQEPVPAPGEPVILESVPARAPVAEGAVALVQQPAQTPAPIDEAATDAAKAPADAAFVF
jgi:hypothetical protein